MCRFDVHDRNMTFKSNFCVLFLHLILQTRQKFILYIGGLCHQEKYMSYRFLICLKNIFQYNFSGRFSEKICDGGEK